jgi:uncharacterized protein (UPF0548 family)
LARSAHQPLTYEPIGVSLGDRVPTGFRRGRWTTELVGPEAFERAAAAIRRWEMQRGSGLTVVADGDIVVGTNAVITAPLPVGYVDAVCRIVAVIDEPERFGFAYGTLPVHPEQGEEAFIVTRASGTTTFSVEAVSRSSYRLGRLVTFPVDRLQDRANRGYLRAIERVVLDGPGASA